MLKDAIVDERRKKAKLTEDLTAIEDKLKKYEVENKKKEEKNEALIAEIKSLKDALIVERNHKQVFIPRPRNAWINSRANWAASRASSRPASPNLTQIGTSD